MLGVCARAGVREAYQQHAGRPGHAPGVRRVAQHREAGGALPAGDRPPAHAARAPQGQHARVPAAPPAHPRRLPGAPLLSPPPLSFTSTFTLSVSPFVVRVLTHSTTRVLVLVQADHRAAGAHRRHDGHLLLHPARHRSGYTDTTSTCTRILYILL